MPNFFEYIDVMKSEDSLRKPGKEICVATTLVGILSTPSLEGASS